MVSRTVSPGLPVASSWLPHHLVPEVKSGELPLREGIKECPCPGFGLRPETGTHRDGEAALAAWRQSASARS